MKNWMIYLYWRKNAFYMPENVLSQQADFGRNFTWLKLKVTDASRQVQFYTPQCIFQNNFSYCTDQRTYSGLGTIFFLSKRLQML